MASNHVFAVLLAGCALSALAHSPCDPQIPQKPDEEPCTPVTAAPGLSAAEITGIAVGSVAGAAAIAGGIAGGVAASSSRRRRRRKVEGGVVVVRNSKEPPVVVRNSQEPLVPVVVPVVVPVLVPGGNRLYNAEDKPALAQTDMAAKVGSSSVLMGVAAFVFFGCAFLAISGFIYARNKTSRSTRTITVQDLEEDIE